MWKFKVKNEEKAWLGANRKGRGFTSGRAVRREVFTGTSKALNMRQVNFYCEEGNAGGDFWSV